MVLSMRLSGRIPLFFVLWLLAEFAAFTLISGMVGLMGALFLCLLTSLAGLAMLRRLGFSTALQLRRAMAARSSGQTGASREAMLDGALVGFGAVLLIIPGFVSDFFGLALAAPSVRNWIQEKMSTGRTSRGPGRKGAPTLVDLDPQEWSRVDQPNEPDRLEPTDRRG
ncbi:exlusion protein FxsA [Methylocella silvestris]|uniref:Exlusion protein FxsA n=2 Tax=Methylocella silvestris TaxID=199596 RepID=A0A2J7TGF0_METSI|nr:exlusion protein FxsA [Methylocella silvestris]